MKKGSWNSGSRSGNNSGTRSPTKKEKLQRIQEQEKSAELAAKYIYPLGAAGVVLFIVLLYLFLYYKSIS
jgi:ribosome assembly protein YihI (activator of Der GTPase)